MKTGLGLVLLVATNAFANGPTSSGGGKGVICRDAQGVVLSAKMLDIYEGKNVFGDEHIANQNLPIEDYLTIAKTRLDETGYRILNIEARSLVDSIQQVQEHLRILPAEAEPVTTDDSFEFIKLGAGCSVVQTAYFSDKDLIAVSKTSWDAFTNLDKASLILHEAIYWMDRQYSLRQDSRHARRVVSLALGAQWTMESVKSDLPHSYVLCQNHDAPLTLFAVYEHDNFQFADFFALNGDMILSRSTAVVNSVEHKFPFIRTTIPSIGSVSAQFTTQSKFEGGSMIRIDEESTPEGLFLKMNATKTRYPTWNAQESNITCHPFN